jgi:hypothetical protein
VTAGCSHHLPFHGRCHRFRWYRASCTLMAPAIRTSSASPSARVRAIEGRLELTGLRPLRVASSSPACGLKGRLELTGLRPLRVASSSPANGPCGLLRAAPSAPRGRTEGGLPPGTPSSPACRPPRAGSELSGVRALRTASSSPRARHGGLPCAHRYGSGRQRQALQYPPPNTCLLLGSGRVTFVKVRARTGS